MQLLSFAYCVLTYYLLEICTPAFSAKTSKSIRWTFFELPLLHPVSFVPISEENDEMHRVL